MLHQKTYVYPAIHAVVLLGRISQVDESERFAQQSRNLVRRELRLVEVGAVERVVVECDAVDDADKKQRPVRSALCHIDSSTVVDWEEDVRSLAKVWERRLECEGVLRLLQHKAHRGSQEHDIRVRIVTELLTLEELLPKADGVVGEPVTFD